MATAASETVPQTAPTVEPSRNETVHIFEPYKYALPKLKPYFRDLWARRQFATHMARSTLKGQHYDSFFGQFWLVLNPLLLATVYFLLTSVLGGGGGLKHFVQILTGVFAFFYTRNIIQFGASSITGGGKMIINMSFPKMLLPLSTTATAVLMYIPTMIVYAIFYLTVHRTFTPAILWIIPIFVIQTMFSFGLGLLFAAVTLYFRDMSTLLPYVLRIWMYVSPVLFSMAYVKDRITHAGLAPWMLNLIKFDPITPIFNAWNTVLVGDGVKPFQKAYSITYPGSTTPTLYPNASYTPHMADIAMGAGWAVLFFLLGAWYFMSREREFAVRL